MSEDRSDKFASSALSAVWSQCVYCKRASTESVYPACIAFQSFIPDEILANKVDHRKPIEGDGGFMFDPRDDVPLVALNNLYAELDSIEEVEEEERESAWA